MKRSQLPPGSTVLRIARHSPGKGQSIDTQLAILDEYCQLNQLTVIHTFIDAGKSGYDRTRPDFAKFVQLVEQSQARVTDGVIFVENARLGRDFEMTQYIRNLLAIKGYIVESVIGQQLPGIAGYVVTALEDHFNQKKVEESKELISYGLKTLVQQKDPETGQYFGVWPAAVPAFFRRVVRDLGIIITLKNQRKAKQCIVPNKDTWHIGQEIFRLKAEGYPVSEIEKRTGWLKSLGTVDVNNLDSRNVRYRYIIRNRIYVGEFHYSGLVIPGYVPAMVSEEIWQAANATAWDKERGDWKERHPNRGKADSSFILAGLCDCQDCSQPFYTRIAQGYHKRYYYCKSYRYNDDRCGCPNGYIKAAEFEQVVIDHIFSHYLNGYFYERVAEKFNALLDNQSGLTELITATETRLKRATAALENLFSFVSQTGSHEEAKTQLAKLKRDKEDAQRELNSLINQRLPKFERVSVNEIRREMEGLRARLTAAGEGQAAARAILSNIAIMGGKATLYYRLPVGLGNQSLWSLVANHNSFGYVIDLPNFIDRLI